MKEKTAFEEVNGKEGTMDREEFQKCCDSPAYFFNNYVLVKNASGEWVKPDPVTDEQLAEAAENARKEYQRNRDRLRCSMAKSLMELFPDVFKGKIVLTAKIKEEFLKTQARRKR